MNTFLKVHKLNNQAIIPTKATPLSAGFDLYSIEDTLIVSKGKALISTGINVELPKETYGRIAPRSGLSWKHFIDVGAGVIDEDYRGEIKVLLFNFGNEDYKVSKGDKIAQLIVEKIQPCTIIEVDSLNNENTLRGEKGFGSSGL